MDIYQKKLVLRGAIDFVSSKGDEKYEFDDSLILVQNENYRIDGYKLTVVNNAIESIECKKIQVANINGAFILDINFTSNNFNLVVKFKNNVAEDCIIPVVLMKADKEKFDLEESKQNHDALIQSMALKMTNGVNCVNVMWKNACDFVEKTIVEIYYVESGKYLLEKCETKQNFVSLGNLAYGRYLANVKQFDSKGILIIENETSTTIANFTDEIKEQLKNVKSQVAASGRHTVTI